MTARMIVALVVWAALGLTALAAEMPVPDPLADGALEFLNMDNTESLQAGRDAYNAGDYLAAAQHYLAALEIKSDDAWTVYNLACCYSLLGEREKALTAIEASVGKGIKDIGQYRRDPDFAALQDAPEFEALLARLEAEQAERAAAAGGLVFFKAPVYLRGRIHFPEGYNPAQPCKLIVGLHGYGHHPEGFSKLAARFNKDGNQFIFVALQAPYAWNNGQEHPGVSWGWGTDEYGLPALSWELSDEYVVNAVEQLQGSYNISETYLLGFSQGGCLALYSGLRHPKLFSGVLSLSGSYQASELTEADVAAAKKLRVFIGHGDADSIVPTAEGKEGYDVLKAAGYDVTYFEFAGGHATPEEETDAALAWINAGSQESAAKE